MAKKIGKKGLKIKEIEYGSIRKRYIDKELEKTLESKGFKRAIKVKPSYPKRVTVPPEINLKVSEVKPLRKKENLSSLKLPKNIDPELVLEKKPVKKEIKKYEEFQIVNLPSHMEYEAPDKIEVKTGIKSLTGKTEGHYGNLPEEIDIVSKDDVYKREKKKSFFSTIKQIIGMDDEGLEELEPIVMTDKPIEKKDQKKKDDEGDESDTKEETEEKKSD